MYRGGVHRIFFLYYFTHISLTHVSILEGLYKPLLYTNGKPERTIKLDKHQCYYTNSSIYRLFLNLGGIEIIIKMEKQKTTALIRPNTTPTTHRIHFTQIKIPAVKTSLHGSPCLGCTSIEGITTPTNFHLFRYLTILDLLSHFTRNFCLHSDCSSIHGLAASGLIISYQ